MLVFFDNIISMSIATKSIEDFFFFAGLGGLPSSLIIPILEGQTPCLAQPRGEPRTFLKTAQFLAFGEVRSAPPPSMKRRI